MRIIESDEDKNNEFPDNAAIESEVERLITVNKDDISDIEAFVYEYDESYDDFESLEEYAFRTAIKLGNTSYVKKHIGDFEINDDEGCCTYLHETDDEEMKDILLAHGAIRPYGDYEAFRFAMETVNSEILVFKPDFQKEVFEKYKEAYGLINEGIEAILTGELSVDDVVLDVDPDLDIPPYPDVESDLDTMGVIIEDGEVSFEDKCEQDGSDLMELLESLGFDFCFDGDSWKFETLGVYYIK